MSIQDDELTHFWREVTSPEADLQEIDLWVVQSVRRMDRFSRMVNSLTAAFGLAFVALLGWMLYEGGRFDGALLGFLCIGTVLTFVWWIQRGLPAVDPVATSLSYQSAMLARLDRQIRLGGTARYWALPILVWELYVFLWDSTNPIWFLDVKQLSLDSVKFPILIVVTYIALVWLSEHSRWGVSGLQAKRARILALIEPIPDLVSKSAPPTRDAE